MKSLEDICGLKKVFSDKLNILSADTFKVKSDYEELKKDAKMFK